MRIAIFEPEADGHHMASFVRAILAETSRRDWEVHLVTTERSTKHPAYQIVAREFGGKFQLHIMPDLVPDPKTPDFQRIFDHFRRWKNYNTAYKKLIQKVKLDAIYMVNLDQADFAMGFKGSPFGQTPFVGSIMGRQFHGPEVGIKMQIGKRDAIFKPIYPRLLKIRTLKRLLCGDQSLIEYTHKLRMANHEKAFYHADIGPMPIMNHVPPAREQLGIPADHKVLLAYGALSVRKGIGCLLDGFAHPDCPNNVSLLLAGRQDSEAEEAILAHLNQNPDDKNRIFQLKGFLDDEHQSLVFTASDAVWVGYLGWYGMSGVMIQAGTAKKPIIAMNEGLVGWLTEREGLGEICEIRNPAEVAQAIKRLFENPARLQGYIEAGIRFTADRTESAFGAGICDHLLAAVEAK
jgi:glycosyltransferase involved in cell wall biosynthesis